MFSQTIFFSTISNLRFLNRRKFENAEKRRKNKKIRTKDTKEERKKDYQFVSLKNISIDRGTNGQISVQSFRFVRV